VKRVIMAAPLASILSRAAKSICMQSSRQSSLRVEKGGGSE
jgi:hypothetical protein